MNPTKNRIDFICIGAQKSATSWLSVNLNQHPKIWLPPLKELHYFDRFPRYPSPSYLFPDTPLKRFFGCKRYNADFRKRLVKELKKNLLKRDKKRLSWSLRYYLGTCSDQWYQSLFPVSGYVSGEITPAYSILDKADVQSLSERFPSLKIIVILRNPLERAWSHLLFNWEHGWFQGIEDLYQTKRFIDSPDQSLRSDYNRIIDIWSSCFPSSQLFIGFYDDIKQDPIEFLQKIFSFLGVLPDVKFADNKVSRAINVSIKRAIPKELRAYLAKKYHPELKKLCARVGRHSTSWLNTAERILENDSIANP